ncbi:hypothetical protein CDAR_500281 [Caerostris darwini]|uniref:Uncharacterized protein n=1 Tax=Caerostris darwini TaxID=1538125 RepID=A0AAV4M8N0_9ARAC|nr:hypothetical protein CDAR_500281 [Caerostris darwini]
MQIQLFGTPPCLPKSNHCVIEHMVLSILYYPANFTTLRNKTQARSFSYLYYDISFQVHLLPVPFWSTAKDPFELRTPILVTLYPGCYGNPLQKEA